MIFSIMRVMAAIVLMILCNCAIVSCVLQEQDESLIVDLREKEKEMVPLADPFIMLYDGIYYAYGTTGNKDFFVYISSDLKYWENYETPVLTADVSFGGSRFWAPEVYYDEDLKKFQMYYSSEMYLCVATSDSPLGPFVQDEKKTILNNYCGIDPTLFVENGKKYLCFSMITDRNYMCITPINSVNAVINNNVDILFSTDQRWEGKRTVEGGSIIKVGKKYVMTYSGNDFSSPEYGIGVAFADNIMGPWTKYAKNPIIQYPSYKSGVLGGTGHNSIFTDKDGKLRIVFHAHSSVGYSGGRYMYIGSLNTHDKEPYISIKNDIFAARLVSAESEMP